MSSMTAIYKKFIAKHDLEITEDDLDGLVKQALVAMYDSIKDTSTSTKKEKVELTNPSKARSVDDLRNCNKDVLTVFCKENGLRVTGTKKELMERVWRCLQEESSDDDISPRSKEKKEKKAVVKNDCCGKTARGTPCQVNGDEIINGKCYCWRHAKDVVKEDSDDEEFQDAEEKPKKKASAKKKEPESDSDDE
jgi:hypothetical protein